MTGKQGTTLGVATFLLAEAIVPFLPNLSLGQSLLTYTSKFDPTKPQSKTQFGFRMILTWFG